MLNALALIDATQHRLSAIDLAIVAVYLLGITIFGLRFRKGSSNKPADKSLKSYFLADNTIPWWAIALSVVSAETSTLTIISIPGLAYGGNFGFLQVALGYMVGRVIVALLFLPRYFKGEMLTAYQLIDQRFGKVLHKVTAGLFLLTRAAAEGVRVFAVSIVVGLAIGTRDVWSIAIICALTLLYTFEGGLAAVIWTDVVQMAIYVIGTAIALLTLGSHIHGGWHEILTVAGSAGKFHWLDFSLNLTSSYTFWAGVLGGTFLTMASHGTDQLMVQRLLAARNLRQGQAALLGSGLVIFAQFVMFLLIGAGLYVFQLQNVGIFAGLTSDRLFPAFIVREMPLGIAGLLIAAILAAAMSNLSAALNSSPPPRSSTSSSRSSPTPLPSSARCSRRPRPSSGRSCFLRSPSLQPRSVAKATSLKSASASRPSRTVACSASSCSAPSRALPRRSARASAWSSASRSTSGSGKDTSLCILARSPFRTSPSLGTSSSAPSPPSSSEPSPA
ncbi:hypothetical protein ACFQBQ_18570 [Granulicella cerasi]|uniref:Sodium/solute symporter n=1 Tax=Granulicella cerasi TaxID=741063 RepID=A0ABW1ZDP0_9BACT